MWLGTLAAEAGGSESTPIADDEIRLRSPQVPAAIAKAKRVIYLHMAGAPSQLELFDYKPVLQEFDGKDCPAEFLQGKRSGYGRRGAKLLGSQYSFAQHGDSGAWVSDRLPRFSEVVDSVSFIHSMQTDQMTHAPAQLRLHTGNADLGFPSIGAWMTYGLGTENQNLPGYVVLVSGGKVPSAGKSVWSNGFLPADYQGIQCRIKADPVLFLSDPEGTARPLRSEMIDTISQINRQTYEQIGDPATVARIGQFEMAFRMQMAATEATDLSQETAEVQQLYGADPGKKSFANNCLLARRLVERGVRYVQLFDGGWDSHGADPSEAINVGFKNMCNEMDRPIAALLKDLKRSGLLDETLVVWGGEFGRSPLRDPRGNTELGLMGRHHQADAFTVWMAGGGVKGGVRHGATDELGFSVTEDPTPVRDLHATMLRLLGLDQDPLGFPFEGGTHRLTGEKTANVIEPLLA
ncbi:hypothetical protein FF011L_23930 [Roseimaritima multifibrata]|uniref:Sulfatase n=2 Tax=Roseimaritima multifibrata TaxID=1930274 RepID=A0A517MFF5_9BACT|nr:hypothetical protein FF011L_23930 [Roseimaritima multifibrata]